MSNFENEVGCDATARHGGIGAAENEWHQQRQQLDQSVNPPARLNLRSVVSKLSSMRISRGDEYFADIDARAGGKRNAANSVW